MSLSGLLPVVTADPDLGRALDQAAELPALGGDLIAPASLRPLLVAALAGAARPDGRSASGPSASGPGAPIRPAPIWLAPTMPMPSRSR